MKKLVFFVLCSLVGFMGYFTYNAFCDNLHLKNKFSLLSDSILENEKQKEEYLLHKKELDELREANGDKVSKYEEVEAWNQEIIKYLD